MSVVHISANQNCLLIEHLSGHIDDFIPNTNQMNLSFKFKKRSILFNIGHYAQI